MGYNQFPIKWPTDMGNAHSYLFTKEFQATGNQSIADQINDYITSRSYVDAIAFVEYSVIFDGANHNRHALVGFYLTREPEKGKSE